MTLRTLDNILQGAGSTMAIFPPSPPRGIEVDFLDRSDHDAILQDWIWVGDTLHVTMGPITDGELGRESHEMSEHGSEKEAENGR